MKKYILLLLCLCFQSNLLHAQLSAGQLQVTTDKGMIEGFIDQENQVAQFFGVPFAQPPVGDLRWKAPQPAKAWQGVKETKAFGPAPMQIPVFGDMKSRGNGMSEDCLYLNIWAPLPQKKKNLPVLVYFYGGGFVAGDASEPRYDGTNFAKEGIVVVTVNYRLNVFGSLAHPALSKEAKYSASGNYGLLDQHAALVWVKNNIEQFGGDPDHITIGGESAGSISVSAQMASPLSKDLLFAAIGESGAAIHPTLAPVSLTEAENIGKEFTDQLGLKSLEEMRGISAEELLQLYGKSGRFGFPSVIDNYFLPNSLPEIFEAEKQAQIPLLVGWNSAEIPGASLMKEKAFTKENYTQIIKELYPEDYERVLALYPVGDPAQIRKSATDLASDRFIVYSTWKWFDLHRKNSDQPVYRYVFDKIRPPLKDKSKVAGLAGGTSEKKEGATTTQPKPIGAAHAAEIEYAFNNLATATEFEWSKEDKQVAQVMFSYFANFIKNANPNHDELPTWPAVKATAESPIFINIGVKTEAQQATTDDRYLFLDHAYRKEKSKK